MAERQRGRDPNKHKGSDPERREPQQERYIKAVRYRDEHDSEAPYDALRDLIERTPCNMSAYRQLLIQTATDTQAWLVVALGIKPPIELTSQIDALLAEGAVVTLDEEVIQSLFARRERQQKKGQWVERRDLQRRKRRLS